MGKKAHCLRLTIIPTNGVKRMVVSKGTYTFTLCASPVSSGQKHDRSKAGKVKYGLFLLGMFIIVSHIVVSDLLA